jgi:SNF2 family DNA or RNA helicase
MGLGKTL